MAKFNVEFDTSNPQDLEMVLRMFSGMGGDKTLTLDPGKKAATDKSKPAANETKKQETKNDAPSDAEVNEALSSETVTMEQVIALAKTKTGVAEVVASIGEKKVSTCPDHKLGHLYKELLKLPNRA